MSKIYPNRNAVTLLIVLAMMVMFAMLVTTFMVIVTLNRRNSESIAKFLIEFPSGGGASSSSGGEKSVILENGELEQAFQLILTGSEQLESNIAPHSILENLFGHSISLPFSGLGTGYEASDSNTLLSRRDGDGKPFALRPNPLAPSSDGSQEYKNYLEAANENVQMNPDYTAPDYMTMFLAWNDFRDSELKGIIPSFHRPQLVRYWNDDDPNELRKYVLRPLPTDHPRFTGRNPAATVKNLKKFLTEGPWDVDNDGDGRADGIWLDIGLPVQEHTTGELYKPLVSYYVVDMDGRINVNTSSSSDSSTVSGKGKGTGLGTAELSSGLLTKKTMTERYGTDGVGKRRPGTNIMPSDIPAWLLKNNGINSEAYMQGGIVADWLGTLPIDFDDQGNRKAGVPLPIEEIPYLINPYDKSSGDTPFMAEEGELESLLRSIVDVDYAKLPLRLRNLLGDSYDPQHPALTLAKLRYSLTTRSSDIPVAAINYAPTENGYIPLQEYVRILSGGTDELWDLLPEEIKRGEKANLNRLTLRDDWMTGGSELLNVKAKFAQEIYYLLRVLITTPTTHHDDATLERLAQWSVNVVDFLDPDDVMTPFIFKKTESQAGLITPFDNAELVAKVIDGKLTQGDLSSNNCSLIWGFEKSEVALTETLAIHDRRVKDTTGDRKFRQVFRPQGYLFVELYRQGDLQRVSGNRYQANSLVESDGSLDLAKKTTIGNNYIWRLAIGEAIKDRAADTNKFGWNDGSYPERNALEQLLMPRDGKIKYPQFYQWHDSTPSGGQYHPDLGAPERYVWFGGEFPTTDSETNRRSFINGVDTTSVTSARLMPNSSLVVAPPEVSHPEIPFFVSLPPGTNTMIASNRIGVNFGNIDVPIPGYMGVNASESFDGYTRETGNNTSWFDIGILYQRGTIACFKSICLQRLADPNRAHHPICNPYLTVDWNMIDLQVFNSEDLRENEMGPYREPLGKMCFSSRQWKPTTVSDHFNLWDRTLKIDDGVQKPGLVVNAYTDYISLFPPKHSLGNPAKYTPGGTGYLGQQVHFPWNDAPFTNSGEAMLVPSSASGRFGVEFHDNGTDNKFFGSQPRFGDPSFSSASLYLDWTDFDMPRWFDFVHVPSRFSGTRNTDGSVYREPGKINLNTITEEGWNALKNGRSHFPSYDEFHSYRQWSGSLTDFPSEFRPFRSASATRLVAPLETTNDALYGPPVSATLLGWESGGSPVMMDDSANNSYSVMDNVMRLSDVTTTRSNVFGIWITVGYFKVEKCENLAELKTKYKGHNFDHIANDQVFKAVYPDGYVLGTEMGQSGDDEMGLDDSAVRRYRAFYLIDRSSPLEEYHRGLDLEKASAVIVNKTVLEQGSGTQTQSNRFRDDTATTVP